MLRAYLHNDYDDDGRVGNDDGDDDDDADECSYLGCIYCRDWMMTFPIGSRGPSVFFFFSERRDTRWRRAQSQTDICIKVMFWWVMPSSNDSGRRGR